MLPVQVEPAQHSLVSRQLRPGAVQLPVPEAQRPLTHCLEQQSEELEQSSPPASQPHFAFLHCPSQQSEWKRQSAPLDLHARRHWPFVQAPSQHSEVAPHGWRSPVHFGGGCIAGLQAARSSTQRVAERSTATV